MFVKNSSESMTEPCGTPQVVLVSVDICESNFKFNFKVYERYRFSISLFVSLACRSGQMISQVIFCSARGITLFTQGNPVQVN